MFGWICKYPNYTEESTMKTKIFLMILLFVLPSCSTIKEMQDNIHESTRAIKENSEVVQDSSIGIAENRRIVDESSIAIGHNTQTVNDSSEAIAASNEAIRSNAALVEKLTGAMMELEKHSGLLSLLAFLAVVIIFTPLLIMLYIVKQMQNMMRRFVDDMKKRS